MTSLIILGSLLLACWLWAMWRRDGAAAFMQEWSYALLVAAVMCYVMALGLKLR
jgi:hypothetical protein